jgi:hypothetical protein
MRVATHPMLAGYVFRVFFIDEPKCERKKSRGWKDSIARCNQAELIRQVVQQHRFGHFKVPRKWPFHTPSHPSCAPDNQPMTLVAEFRDLVPIKDNAHARRRSITHGRLDELHAIIESEEARATGRTTFRSPAKVGLPSSMIAGINHCVKFLSYFTPRLDIRGANIQNVITASVCV